MADYLLDTNIIKYWYDTHCKQHASVIRHVQAVSSVGSAKYVPRLFICVVTLGEVEYGHRVTLVPAAVREAAFNRFIKDNLPQPFPVSDHVATDYGKLRGWLFNTCSPKGNRSKARRAEELENPTSGEALHIQENDIWIAAVAMTHGMVLVTNDSKGNFGRLLRQFSSELKVENWAI